MRQFRITYSCPCGQHVSRTSFCDDESAAKINSEKNLPYHRCPDRPEVKMSEFPEVEITEIKNER